MANSLFFGVVWRAIWGRLWRTSGMMFSTPPPTPGIGRPPVCTHHPTFVTRSAAGLQPVPLRGRGVLLWRGPYQLEVAKDEGTDGDALVHWTIGGFPPPERPASA